MIPNRHGIANNKYIKLHDPDKPSKLITYLDANNLYGWAMCEALPKNSLKMDDPKMARRFMHPRG